MTTQNSIPTSSFTGYPAVSLSEKAAQSPSTAEESPEAPADQLAINSEIPQDDFFSTKNNIKQFFRHIGYQLDIGGSLMAATGGVGTVIGVGGALILGGPVLVSAVAGAAIGATAGYAICSMLSHAIGKSM